VEGKGGKFYAWDGNHGIGVAFSAGVRNVPAIVGLQKTGEIPNPVCDRLGSAALKRQAVTGSLAKEKDEHYVIMADFDFGPDTRQYENSVQKH
jgi:hypothetical protein